MEVIMENNKQQNSGGGFQSNTAATGTGSNPQGSIGSAGREGTQAYNNGNEGNTGSNRGKEESGAFDSENAGGYEGGKLGTAGSGGMDIPATESGVEGAGKINEGGGTSASNSD